MPSLISACKCQSELASLNWIDVILEEEENLKQYFN